MSPYSMPLWTILTKWPAPLSPTQSQQGTPWSTFAAMALEDGPDVRPRLGVAAGHERRAVARAFLAAGDARADEEDALFLAVLVAAHGVLVERVAAVDDDVAFFEQGREEVDELVDRRAGLHQQHDAARFLEQPDEFLEAVRADDLGALGLVGEKFIDLADGAIVDRDDKAVVVHVEDDVLAHDGQSDEGDVSSLRHKRHAFWG